MSLLIENSLRVKDANLSIDKKRILAVENDYILKIDENLVLSILKVLLRLAPTVQ